jgi:DNA-binding NarL/FixJ family response regulator
MSRVAILIVDPSLEHARFIEEALAEAQETRATALTFSCLHLEQLEDAILVLQSEPRDAVLLGFETGDRKALDSFRAVRRAAPQVAVIPAVPPQERDFGRALLRRGAQDYLIRFDFDHLSIARALENAIERHRFLSAAESSAVFDTTDLLNQRGFLFIAERLGWNPAYVTVCALQGPTPDRETGDSILLEAAETIQAATTKGELVARCGDDRFAIFSRRPENFAPADFRSVCLAVTGDVESALAAAEHQLSCENGVP